MKSLHYKKRKNRLREVGYDKIEEIKEAFSFTQTELALLLDISTNQLNNYRKTYSLPASRYYALKDALLLQCEDELRDRRNQIITLFG